jgi:hypothetical protein
VLCGATEGLRFHQKFFKNHQVSLHYVYEHPNDFVMLCQRCHLGVHFLQEVFGMTWNDILSLKKSTDIKSVST